MFMYLQRAILIDSVPSEEHFFLSEQLSHIEMTEGSPSIIPELLSRDFAAYFDDLLRQIVMDKRDTIHGIIDTILAGCQKQAGKGHVTGARKAMKSSSSAPTYTLKDPKVTPTATAVKASNAFYPNIATRSIIEPLAERRDNVTTPAKLYDAAAEECRQVVDSIVQGCIQKGSGCKFFDQSFYFDRRSVMYPDGSPADCTVGEPKMAKRLSELYPSCEVFVEGIAADDIVQGGVGDCFLIGAISATAANDPRTLQRLIVAHNKACGVYGVVFYKDGGWEWVVVDDFVAVNKGRSGSLYPLYAAPGAANPSAPTELWPCILEKAYAKLHYNWDTIDGGWAREAVVDLTGGTDYVIDLYRDQKNMTLKQFSRVVQDPLSVVSCAVGDHVEDSSDVGSAGEAGAVFGLFKGHQYGVLDSKECSDGVGFVKVRNPWGQSEWTGPYSDGSKDWKQNPLHKQELNPTFEDDGDFWMRWEDFKQYMTQVDVVCIFPETAAVMTMYSTAGESGVSASGVYLLQVVAESPQANKHVTIVVSQEDPKTKFDSSKHAQQKSTPYGVLRVKINRLRAVPKTTDDVDSCRDRKICDKSARERNITVQEELQPGLYSITVSVAASPNSNGVTPAIAYYTRVATNPDADGKYALWRPQADSARLVVGNCPSVAEMGDDCAISGVCKSGGVERTTTTKTPTIVAPVVPSAKQEQSAPSSSRGTFGATPSNLDHMSRDELRQALEEELKYHKHIEELYRKDNAVALNSAQEVQRLKQIVGEQDRELQKLRAAQKNPANSNISYQDPSTVVGLPRAAAAPFDMVGLRQSEWNELVQGTFSIASRNRGSVGGTEAVVGIRSLITSGLGIDEILEEHPLLRAGKPISLADFARLAADVVTSWGFQRVASHSVAPDMSSREL